MSILKSSGLLLILVVSFALSCTKKSTSSDVPQAILDLKPQNDNCTCEPYVNQYKWNNEIVYVLA